MEKIYVIVSVARQVEGEIVVVKPEKAYKSRERAEESASKLARQYAETVTTPTGPVQCVCTRGVFEIEVED